MMWTVYAIAISDELGNVYYLNRKTSMFQKECTQRCVFFSKRVASRALEHLGISSANVIRAEMLGVSK